MKRLVAQEIRTCRVLWALLVLFFPVSLVVRSWLGSDHVASVLLEFSLSLGVAFSTLGSFFLLESQSEVQHLYRFWMYHPLSLKEAIRFRYWMVFLPGVAWIGVHLLYGTLLGKNPSDLGFQLRLDLFIWCLSLVLLPPSFLLIYRIGFSAYSRYFLVFMGVLGILLQVSMLLLFRSRTGDFLRSWESFLRGNSLLWMTPVAVSFYWLSLRFSLAIKKKWLMVH
ncbi:MAG TPA: hypothetical protein P5560_07375 [Thermotogota bacterium]|nr:hypothetical protein [Thermotogota bacterium]HRW92745.1 hypothetical protein [Thermotogota bacterium]